MNINDSASFWRAVKSRRNTVFYWWLAWIPVNVMLGVVYRRAFHQEAGTLVMWLALLGWGFGSMLLSYRLLKLPCPHCRQLAFKHIFFRMQNARCQYCGFSYTST